METTLGRRVWWIPVGAGAWEQPGGRAEGWLERPNPHLRNVARHSTIVAAASGLMICVKTRDKFHNHDRLEERQVA